MGGVGVILISVKQKYTGLHHSALPRLWECCRQVEAELVSNSRNKILKTWAASFEALVWKSHLARPRQDQAEYFDNNRTKSLPTMVDHSCDRVSMVVEVMDSHWLRRKEKSPQKLVRTLSPNSSPPSYLEWLAIAARYATDTSGISTELSIGAQSFAATASLYAHIVRCSILSRIPWIELH